MPSKTPFGPESIVIQRHTQYSVQATDGAYYRVNQPLTLLHFTDGMTYQVKGSVSTKGNKYISEIVSGAAPAVAEPSQPAGLPPLPPAPSVPATVAPVAAVPAPTPSPVPASPKAKVPPPYKGDDVEGKIACALGAGLVQYLASTSQSEAEFLAGYKSILPQLIAYHKEQGWS